jgi:DNA-binding NtrC family response regulator
VSRNGPRQSRTVPDGMVLGSVVVLLTDVEPAVRLNAALESRGITTVLVSPLDDVRGMMRRARPSVVVLTGALLDGPNLGLVREQLWDGVSVVGFTDVIDEALQARLRMAGYTELFAKPIAVEEVADAVQRRLERRALAEVTGLVGESEAIREVLVKVEQIAPVTSTVLIEGESGTGKELVARAIHRLARVVQTVHRRERRARCPRRCWRASCSGTRRGRSPGRPSAAWGASSWPHGGTLFLDEIGEIPSTQVKLLRVLEEREVTRVGGAQSHRVDVRVVAATNRRCASRWRRGRSGPTSTTGSTCCASTSRRCASVGRTSRCSCGASCASSARLHDRPFHGISAEALRCW